MEVDVYRLLITMSLFVALAACAPERPSISGHASSQRPSSADAPVLVVNGEKIGYDEYMRRIEALPSYARSQVSTVDKQQAFLEAVLQFEIMADVAEKRGYGDDPRVIDRLKDQMAELAVEQALHEEMRRDEMNGSDPRVADLQDDAAQPDEARRKKLRDALVERLMKDAKVSVDSKVLQTIDDPQSNEQ